MKTKFFTLALTMLVLGITVNAQTADESRVKILRTANPDVIKVLYANEISEPLQIKFTSDDGQVTTDKIKGNFEKGLAKCYNVKNINKKDFWVEISSPQMVLTYRIIPSDDSKGFTPFLEKTQYNHVLVRANN